MRKIKVYNLEKCLQYLALVSIDLFALVPEVVLLLFNRGILAPTVDKQGDSTFLIILLGFVYTYWRKGYWGKKR